MADTSNTTQNENDLFESILREELIALEGIHQQNPETGANIRNTNGEGSTYISKYTNRIFGAPYQLLDSADKRFSSINKYLGNEYLRHFILNGPILHIKPGMPQYTGSRKSNNIGDLIGKVFLDTNVGGMDAVQSLLSNLASNTIFSSGAKLQKRMYGFRETYYQYNQHVNYMCRSMAAFLGLNDSSYYGFNATQYDPSANAANKKLYPCGTFNSQGKFVKFQDFKWENYRMLQGSKVMSPSEFLAKLDSGTLWGAAVTNLLSGRFGILRTLKDIGTVAIAKTICAAKYEADDEESKKLLETVKNGTGSSSNAGSLEMEGITDAVTLYDKICSVQFMVEPISYDETFTNTTGDSAIASTINGITNEIGNEIAFISGSKVDAGIIGTMMGFLGDTVANAAESISGIVEPIAGGFASNLFSGAIKGLKGEKMIYPKIYNNSEYANSYQFTVNLSTPYGDVYNYYMNIVVPLCHLLCLAAPRMVTSNATKSPYLVQLYMPGMITCQLGMITNMQITKNPNANRVSVNGFPLDVKVTFSVEELYHSFAISPANDPASFLYNETLNNYMANLAGLMPSVGTYTNQRQSAFNALAHYFAPGKGSIPDAVEDLMNDAVMDIEDLVNPYVINGS